jgi:type I restriction enzyme, S subunit
MSFEATYKVADLIASSKLWIGDGYRAKNSELGSSGIPFARAGDINDGFHFKSGDHLPESDSWKAGNKLSEVGDVVFTSKGTVGRFGYVTESIRKFVYSPQLCFWRSLDNEAIHPRFLFYWVQGKEFFGQYKSVSQKTDMAEYVSLSDQRAMEITLPNLDQQKAIAHILGTLDDRIELNRKTNKTLEAMAKALFKSWFVEFDPVRAKAEGRSTGLPAEISDLFPDSFEDSELGEIPSGWRVGTIASSVGVVFDGPHATPKEADEGNVFLGIKNMTGTSLDLSEVKLIGKDDWSQWTRRVEPRAGDIVFTYEAALGLFAVIPDGLKCCLGRRMALIRTRISNGTPYFWFHQFVAKPFQKVIEERSIHGATVNRTPLTEFPGYPILEAPEGLRLAFDQAASSIWARIHALANQTTSLASLRDTLLPKLISGELRIPDVAKLLEEAGF